MTTSQDNGADRPETGTTEAPTATARPQPAEPGVIASADIGAGKPAQAGQPGEIRPIDSTLVGDQAGGLPAAAPKSAATGSAATPSDSPPQKSPDPKSPDPKPSDSTAVPRAAPVPAPVPAPRRSGGFWPLALGGAVAAGIGAAAAIYALPQLPPEWQPATAPQDSTQAAAPVDEAAILAAAENAAEEATRRFLAEELAALPQTEAFQPPQDLLDGIEQQAMRIDALEEQLAAQPDAADAPDLASQLAELQQRLDAQQTALDELAARPAFDPEAAQALQQQIETAAAEAEERLAAAQAEAQTLQDAAAASTRRAEAVAAIAALQSALDQGVTPDEAREALAAAGLDAPEALATPVPSLTELQAEFPEAARAALRAGLRAESAGGQGNLVTNFLRAQTGARSVAPREGDDPDAVLSRANAQVEGGAIAPALEELAALPEAARTAPAMAAWLARADTYASAQAALSDLSSDQN